MRNNLEAVWTPPGAEDYRNYLIHTTQRPLDVEELNTVLTVDSEVPEINRVRLSLLYHGYVSAVAYFAAQEEALVLEHMRKTHGKKSYRVSSTLRWPALFAHQVVNLVQDPQTSLTRLAALPITDTEENITDFSAEVERFNMFVSAARLSFSKDAGLYVRDFPDKRREI